MSKNLFTGVGTALATPFCGYNAGFIAWGSLLDNAIEAQITAGVNFLVPCGTTGESPTLSHEEHDQVIVRVVEKVNGRVPVLAGTGSNNTAEAVRLTKAAKAAGADGVISVLSNILPGEMVRLVDSLRNHDWKKARICHYGLLKIMRAMFLETNPIPVKTALGLMYPDTFPISFRSPMCEIGPDNWGKLVDVLKEYQLIK